MIKKIFDYFKSKKSTIAETWYDYYKDQVKEEVLIRFSFRIPSRIQNFTLSEHPLYIRQDGSEIFVNYHRKITKSLLNDIQVFFDDFKNKIKDKPQLIARNPSRYIVGFIEEIFPRINKEISKIRYREGHLILRNISQFDVYDVFVIDKNRKISAILWPLALPNLENIPEKDDVIFVRDLIDAMTEYFYFNLDECVRKVITSLENYFIYYKLEPKSGSPPKSRFIRQVNDYIVENLYEFKERDLEIVRDNILFIYQIRNRIVHDKFRLDPKNTIVCKKAIGTLLYIYQSKYTTEDGKRKPIFSLDMHFKMIADSILGINLDIFEKMDKSTIEPEVIHNGDELNESMFKSLKIKEAEKESLEN